MGVFSANALGILLMIGGILLLLAEALTPGVGIFLTGGILCIILGALFLPPAPSPPSGFFVSHEWWTAFLLTILAAGIAGSAFFAFALGKAIKLRRRKATTGTEELLGMTGKADTDIAPEGRIRVRGELWNARIERGGETIKRGEDAKIINREGLTLIVRKKGGDKNGI
jgi:membrane-bound serine protease (ClpP class)